MKTPLLRGTLIGTYRTGNGDRQAYLSVWCPFCGRHHEHGWGIGDIRPEHRAAHCGPESPLHATGYWIAPWRATDAESKGHVVAPRRVA